MPIPPQVLEETLDDIEAGVPQVIGELKNPWETYSQLTFFLEEQFGKIRQDDSMVKFTQRPWYIGIYRVNTSNPLEIITSPWRGPSPACSPINIERGGVLWAAATSGLVQYEPDVEALDKLNPEGHVNCSHERPDQEPMRGMEIAIPLFGAPIKNGEYAGHRAVEGIWDIDNNIKNIYGYRRIPTEESLAANHYIQRLERILRGPGERIVQMMNGERAGVDPEENPKLYLLPPEKSAA